MSETALLRGMKEKPDKDKGCREDIFNRKSKNNS